MPRITTAQRLTALETAVSTLVEALTAAQANTAPAKAAPAKATAESPFVGFLRERAAAKVACEIHDPKICNRRFSPKSSGRTTHVGKLV